MMFFLIRITLTWYDKKMFEQKLLVTYKDITNKIEGLINNICSKNIQIIFNSDIYLIYFFEY